jgi:small-conductance mechanosensitive channel
MPYRRLPKTDQARLHALQRAVQQAGNAAYNDQAINYRTLAEAQRFLMQFENQVAQYHANFDSKVSANRQYRHRVRNARMYISHFIQVLNLSVIRGEIKRQQKELYKLDPKSNSLPDLTTEEGLLEWGKNIIDGEQQRTAAGGFAIYNPAINKVKVHYEIFKED